MIPQDRDAGQRRFNISDGERIASLALGTFLTLGALRRRSLVGLVSAAAGTLMLTRGVTGHSRVYARLGIDRPDAPVLVRTAVTIARSPEEVYAFWRDLGNLPRFMHHLESVTVVDERRSHWVARPPATRRRLEWDAEIVEDRPNALLRWRSLPGADLTSEGSVSFRAAPAGRGSEVHLSLSYRPPLGAALGRLMAPISTAVLKQELRGLKRLLETGEIATTEGQPSARRRTHRPPREDEGAS